MAQTIVKTVKSMLAEANADIVTLSVEEAMSRHGREDVLLIDIRDPRELEREGAVPGAFHAPRGMLEFWIDPESPYFKPVFGEDKQFIFFLCGRHALSAHNKNLAGYGPEAGCPCRWRFRGVESSGRSG